MLSAVIWSDKYTYNPKTPGCKIISVVELIRPSVRMIVMIMMEDTFMEFGGISGNM